MKLTRIAKDLTGNIFTDSEQKVLLYLGAVLLLGFCLQIAGWNPPLHAEAADSLLAATATDDTLKVDIRSANTDELMSLPGIGAKRAADVIAYRLNNPFTSVNQITLVKGIGAASYRKMLPFLIRFGNEEPLTEKTGKTKTKTEAKTEYSGKVNLNSASMDQLCSLSGIGEVKATAIIAYREEKGGFKTPEEILEIKGIGPKTFAKIKDRLEI